MSEISPEIFEPLFQGQISAQGILHLRNPNLGPNSGKRILDARILDPNSWVEFLDSVFSSKRGPLKNSPSRNSPPKIHVSKFSEKAHINNEMFFSPFASLINREKLCVSREKIGTQKATIFSPLFFTVSVLMRKVSFEARIFSRKMSEISPEIFEPLFCGSGKIPLNSPTSFCRSARRTICSVHCTQ